MTETQAVSVIVPTTGLRTRKDLLRRAIASVAGQEGVRAVPLVVLNGQEADPDVEPWLRSDPRVRMVVLKEASLPASLKAGRDAVDTPWFAELDDDDVLLPGALAARLRALADRPDYDVVVTNGYRRDAQGDVLHVESMDDVQKDPLRALIRQNWLLPGSWLCRSGSVDASLFEGVPDFLECTYIAIQFATRFRTLFLSEPTVAWYMDTPGSASRSPAYVRGGPLGLSRILELDLPPDVRASYCRRMSGALHCASDSHRREGRIADAWRHHFASLRWPGGIKYLRYTARLLLQPFLR